MNQLTFTRPDDWHLHVRDGAAMRDVVPHSARQFGRALIMPNLRPPVTTAQMARQYRNRILSVVPAGSGFTPLMALYLTDNLPPQEIVRAKEEGVIACKLYPAGVTTNSDAGVTDIRRTYPTLEAMQRHGLTLCIHGEVDHVDPEDAEARFLEEKLIPLRKDFPELRVMVEHISTEEMAQYVAEAAGPIAATVTAHHPLYNRDAIFHGVDREHYRCKPELKKERHRQALIRFMTSGSRKAVLGTDSAPHPATLKAQGGCHGCYTAYAAIEMYAEIFDKAGALDRLEQFASFNGADFYGLPRNTDTITLVRRSWSVSESFPFGEGTVKPMPHQLQWAIQ